MNDCLPLSPQTKHCIHVVPVKNSDRSRLSPGKDVATSSQLTFAIPLAMLSTLGRNCGDVLLRVLSSSGCQTFGVECDRECMQIAADESPVERGGGCLVMTLESQEALFEFGQEEMSFG
jgi:hypothetical protein